MKSNGKWDEPKFVKYVERGEFFGENALFGYKYYSNLFYQLFYLLSFNNSKYIVKIQENLVFKLMIQTVYHVWY